MAKTTIPVELSSTPGITDNSNATAITIDSSEKVGIGNTSPLGKLTISNAAGANAPTSITAANTYLQLGSDDYGASSNGKFMIGFGYTDATNTNSPAYIGFEETSNSGDTKGVLTFHTRDVITDTAPTERMRIDSSGLVGIGQTPSSSDGSMLQITGNDGIQLKRSGQTNGFVIRPNASTDGLRFTQAGTGDRMTIDSSGKVGIGVSPSNNLEIFTDAGDEGLTIKSTGNTSNAIIFDANRSGAGSAIGEMQSKWNGTTVAMIASLTGADTTNKDDGVLAFYTSSANNIAERMRINSNGQILGATDTAPNYPGTFTSARTGASNTTTQNTWGFNATAGGSHKDYGYKASGSGSYAYGVLNAAETAWMARLDFAGAIHLTNTTVQNISDRRLKKDIVDANSQWNDIKALQFKNFKWKDEARGTDTYLGLIADEVESVSPGLVGIDAISGETMPEDGIDPEYKNVKYSIVWMKAVKALQEAMTKIETLEARVKELEE
jgi:hypothetical protein